MKGGSKMTEEELVDFSTFPEGFEKAKAEIDFLDDDDEKTGYLIGLAMFLFNA